MPTPQAPAGKDLLGIQLSDNAWIEFRKHWNELTDAHQINPLLKRYGLTRPQAYRQLADVASRLPTHSIKFMLEQIALLKIPVLIFAPNGVCTQIHNGTIEKLVETGPWFNVLDPKFNMHLQLASVHQVWRVYKPNEQQSIESIELFNDNEQPIAMIYLHTSARENPLLRDKWQGLLKSLAEQSFENRVA
jgi:putative hemin transport protein